MIWTAPEGSVAPVLQLHATRVNLGDDLLALNLRALLGCRPGGNLDLRPVSNQRVPWEEGADPGLAFARLGEPEELQAAVRAINTSGGVILGPGDLISNTPTFVGLLDAARCLGVPILLLGVGVNLRSAGSRVMRAWRRVLPSAALVWAREQESARRLLKLGVPEPVLRVRPDLAYGGVPGPRAAAEPLPANYGVVSMRMPETNSTQWDRAFFARAARSLDRIAEETGIEWVFLPMVGAWQRGTGPARHDDLEAWEELEREMERPLRPYAPDRPIPPGEARSVLAGARLAVTMRLHASILAALAGTPFVSISYSPKIRSWAREAGLERFCVEPTPQAAEELPGLCREVVDAWPALAPALTEENARRERILKDAAGEVLAVLAGAGHRPLAGPSAEESAARALRKHVRRKPAWWRVSVRLLRRVLPAHEVARTPRSAGGR